MHHPNYKMGVLRYYKRKHHQGTRIADP